MEQLDEIPRKGGEENKGGWRSSGLQEKLQRGCGTFSALRTFWHHPLRFFFKLLLFAAFAQHKRSIFHVVLKHISLYPAWKAECGTLQHWGTARKHSQNRSDVILSAFPTLPHHPGKTQPGSLQTFYSALISYFSCSLGFYFPISWCVFFPVFSYFDISCFPAGDFHPSGWYWSISHLIAHFSGKGDTIPSLCSHQVLNPLDFWPPPPKKQELGSLPLPKMPAATQSKRPNPTLLQDLPFLAGKGQGKTCSGCGQGQKRHFGKPHESDIDLFKIHSLQLQDPS